MMNVEIVEKPAFTVIGKRIRTSPKSSEIAELWTNHGASLMSVSNMTQDGSYGVMEIVDMEAKVMDYMAAVGVSEVGSIPDGMEQWEIPAATYAVFEATLPTLGGSFDSFYQEWLPSSDYQRVDGPEFEHYGPGFNPQDPNSKLSVCIPVKKK